MGSRARNFADMFSSGRKAYRAKESRTTTSYTPVLTDTGTILTINNSSPITVTIPPNSSVGFEIGAKIDIVQTGTGQVTVQGGSGVTVNSTPSLSLRAQYSAASCIKTDTDIWVLVGDLQV